MATVSDLVPAAVGAVRVGLSRERLVRAIQRGELGGSCVGGRWFVSERSLYDFIKRCTVHPDAAVLRRSIAS